MKKEFVPYEIALALKELGFDELCIKGFYNKEEIFTVVSTPVDFNSKKQLGELISAPLYQQAFSYLLNHERVIDKGYQLVEESRGNWGLHQEKENHFELILSNVPKIECLKELIEIVKNK